MVGYTYLGYGVTNSEGIAKLDHDATGEPIEHSYAGVGAGEIDVLASLDNPISEGSIVSGTLPVLDCQFYDDGVTGSLSSSWVDTNCTVARESGGYTSIKDTASQNGQHKLNMNIPSSSVIYCDYYQVDGNISDFPFLFFDSDRNYLQGFALGSFAGLNIGEWITFKIETTTTSLIITNLSTGVSITRNFNASYSPSENVVLALSPYGAMTEIRYKELKIYPK